MTILLAAVGGGTIVLFLLVFVLVRSVGNIIQTASQGTPPPADRVAESWMSQPKFDWPQIVLTNYAEFDGHTSLEGASSFLLQSDSGIVYAATAAHLIGPAGGVEPELPISQVTARTRLWRMFPRTSPQRFVEATGVPVDGLDRSGKDWLLLAIRPSEDLPAYPLRVRPERVQVGETVYLIGCPYEEEGCGQNVYEGVVTQRFLDRFRYDLATPVNLCGFSGAPIIDEQGYLVGVMTVWFETKMVGDKDLEGGGEDATAIYPFLR